jgi:hypothetical protein
LADLLSSGTLQVLEGTDVHYINAFFLNGTSVPGYNGKFWGQIGAYLDSNTEKIGYGTCSPTSGTLRTNWADAACSVYYISGKPKIVIVGNSHDCGFSPYKNVFESMWIFNADRTRYVNISRGAEFNWTKPINTKSALSEDYNVIQSSPTNVAIGDVNGDGIMDFIFPAYDGKLYAYSENQKPLSQNFPLSITSPGQSFIEFASEVTIADIDNNGKAEIIFTTWTQSGSKNYGSLYILNWDGTIVQKLALPKVGVPSTQNYGGALAAPTLFKDPTSGNLKIVINSIYAGLVLYEIPNSQNSRIIWGTSKGNYLRDGVYSGGSSKSPVLDSSTSSNGSNSNSSSSSDWRLFSNLTIILFFLIMLTI